MKIKQKDSDRLCIEGQKVESLYDELDTCLAEARGKVTELVAAINEARQEVHGILDDLVTEVDAYYDERSAKWQEGDKGQSYDEWRQELTQTRDEMDEDLELEIPEDPDRPDWLAQVIEGIQTEPNC